MTNSEVWECNKKENKVDKDIILREQVMERIDREYRGILYGRNPMPNCRTIVIPIINNVLAHCEHLKMPEHLVYKLAIVEYHKALSTVMTDKLHEALMKTAVENITHTIIEGE